MSAEIRTLKDGEITVYPRTLASAVYNDDGTTIDTTIQNAIDDTTQLAGNVDEALGNILTGETVTSLNSELDNINGEVVGTDTTAKLNKIESTKAAISQAISDKGVDMSSVSVFGDYAGKIGEIQAGSSFETSEISITYPGANSATFYYMDKDGVYKEESNPIKIEVVLGNVFSVYVYPSNPVEGNGTADFLVTNVKVIKAFNKEVGSGTQGLHVCRTTSTSATIKFY